MIVLAVVAAAGVVAILLLGPGLGFWSDDGAAGLLPEPTPRPAAAVLDPMNGAGVATPRSVGTSADGAPTGVGVERVLSGLLESDALGGRVAAVVADPFADETLFERSAATPFVPASTVKLVTAVAALEVLGPSARFATEVVAGQDSGQIVLVGGGDPTLTAFETAGDGGSGYPELARLADLADETAAALDASGLDGVTLLYDESLFSGTAVNPAWESGYVPSVIAPVSPLMTDGGLGGAKARTRDRQPAREAAGRFAAMLTDRGVTVRSVEAAQPDRSADAETLASVSSPPVSGLVEHMLAASDNAVAEALARHVAIAKGEPASFDGAAQAMTDTLAELGVDIGGLTLRDASGLSRENRVPARVLAETLVLAASPDRPELRSVLTGLPVAGFSGTLDERFADGTLAEAAGEIRAKTGTLTGVSSLAGVTSDADGRLLAFVFMADQVKSVKAARASLDRLAGALAACGCD